MAENQNLYSLKVVLRDDANTVYSMVACILDPKETEIKKYESVASGTPNNLLPVRSTFQDFCNRCQRIVYKSEQLKNISKSLQEVMKATFNSESFKEELLHYMDHNQQDRIQFLFYQLHHKTTGHSDPKIEIHYELIDPKDLGKTTVVEDEVQSEVSSSTSSTGFYVPPDKQLVQFRFQLSPVAGKPLNQIAVGETVYVRLMPGDGVTDSIINSMDLKDESGIIKQVPAKVVNIGHSKNNSEVVIKINEQIYGKISEEENSIKVKTFDASQGSAPLLTSAVSQTRSKMEKIEAGRKSDDSFNILPFLIFFSLAAIIGGAVFIFL